MHPELKKRPNHFAGKNFFEALNSRIYIQTIVLVLLTKSQCVLTQSASLRLPFFKLVTTSKTGVADHSCISPRTNKESPQVQSAQVEAEVAVDGGQVHRLAHCGQVHGLIQGPLPVSRMLGHRNISNQYFANVEAPQHLNVGHCVIWNSSFSSQLQYYMTAILYDG